MVQPENIDPSTWNPYYVVSISTGSSRDYASLVADADTTRPRLFHPFYAIERFGAQTILAKFGRDKVRESLKDGTVNGFNLSSMGPQLTQIIRWIHEVVRSNQGAAANP